MFAKLLILLGFAFVTRTEFVPHVINGTLDSPLQLVVNYSVEYIIRYPEIKTVHPLRVHVTSDDALSTAPILVVVRQKKEVVSWQIPMKVDDNNDDNEYRTSARTLCYDSTHDNRTLFQALIERGLQLFLSDNPIISISTSSLRNVTATVMIDVEENFYVQPNKSYTVTVTPSEPRLYFYNFPDNATIKDNTKTVILEMTSPDDICMTISIQNASCPVYDLNHDVKFEGYWETVNRKGGITISKSKFPLGFFLVFVPKADDYDCTGDVRLVETNRNKTITYKIVPSIAYVDYVNAIMATVCAMVLFYVVFGVAFFVCSSRVYVPRSMEYMSSPANTPTTVATDVAGEDNISYDETEYDTIAETTRDDDDILYKPVICLSDLAKKDFRILKRKSYSYLWHVLTVALFYGLPVVQLVITYQRVLNDTGNQDLCFYNFLCAHPLGFFSDFNHLFSNLGYVMFGLLYLWIVWRRENWHKDTNFDQHYGIPQHFGLFYALGVALITEGVLSGAYHICPNHSNFQFDTSFMYVMAVLCMVKIYQTRHPDINATAYSTFGVLAVAILIGMFGILESTLSFWIGFTVVHISAGFYLTVQVYYMGCCRMNKVFLSRVFNFHEFPTKRWRIFVPIYKGRFVLLVFGNICNWAMAAFGLYHHDKDFATYLLGIFMMNTLMYFIFYIIMKLLHKERINNLALVFLIISLSCAAAAMYCFLNKSISWALTPAGSRQFNHDCTLMRFYDYHDIWHFLSSCGMFFMFMVLLLLDEDLSHTHRSLIPVF